MTSPIVEQTLIQSIAHRNSVDRMQYQEESLIELFRPTQPIELLSKICKAAAAAALIVR